jgi:ERCC4-type nuclease
MKILVDTNEKTPWRFDKYDVETASKNLYTGDYTVEGLEDILCIERKSCVTEIANNITTKRFTNELERMTKFPQRYLILEFDYGHIDSFPQNTNIPSFLKNKIRVKGPFIIKFLSQIMTKYDIKVIPCTNREYAEYIAHSIMKEVYVQYNHS